MEYHRNAKWDGLAADIEDAIESVVKGLRNLPEETVKKRPSPSDWSAKEVVGHLIDSASNNQQRFVRLQITDGLIFPEYGADNEDWVIIQRYQEASWNDLLDLFLFLNRHIARIIRHVNEACIDHIWVVDEDRSITLGELMIDYLRHLKDHITQIEACIGESR